MKTTSIYTLFFSPTGTSRENRRSRGAGDGRDERESHAGVRRRQHGTRAPCRANPGSGNRRGGTGACRREQRRNGKRARGTGCHSHRPDLPRRTTRSAAGWGRRHIRRAGLRKARGTRSPGTPAGDPRRRHSGHRPGRLRQPLVRHGRRRARLVRRGAGIRARSGRGIRRRAFVQHARNPDRTGTPRRAGSGCRHGIRGSGARKISENRVFSRQEPGNGIRHRSNHPDNPNRQHGCSQGPRDGALVPIDPAKLREPRTPLLPKLRFIRFVLATAAGRNATPSSCCPREMPHVARNAAAASHCAPRRPSHAATSCTPTRHAASAAAPA